MTKGKTMAITKDVEWIGILDPDLRIFDIIMETQFGTSYNSYFIHADKKCIIETAKEKFKDEYLAKVKKVCNPEEIKYIVLDHTEPDHSGSLKHLLEIAPAAAVVGSGNAIRYLKDIVGHDFDSIVVKDGDTLDLGNKTLRFISAPNLHWPDSIYTWLEEDKILFTCDSFGAHYCDERLFDDMVGNFDEAFKYYFDVILRPFSKFMLKAIEKIKDLDIHTICTGHGPVLRTYWKKYVHMTEEFARQEIAMRDSAENSVFIPYVSAYGYTQKMAEAIARGIQKSGNTKVHLEDLQDFDFDKTNQLITVSSAIIVGSPTLNQNILPQIYQLFGAINPIRDKGKYFAAFGSYGWSGEGVNIIENAMSTLKLKKALEGLKIRFSPQLEMEELVDFGQKFTEAIKN
jgi:NADH oxidase (H2O-forming)